MTPEAELERVSVAARPLANRRHSSDLLEDALELRFLRGVLPQLVGFSGAVVITGPRDDERELRRDRPQNLFALVRILPVVDL